MIGAPVPGASIAGAGMQSRRFMVLLAVSLACAGNPVASAHAEGAAAACPQRPAMQTPARYPDEMKGKGIGGDGVLILSLDTCGRVTDASFEKSTGQRAFDKAAMAAARTWQFDPELGNRPITPGRVRVPVSFVADFSKPSADAAEQDRDRALGADLRQKWQRRQVPAVAKNADGLLDGILPDPLPFEGGFADNLERLRRDARLQSDERGARRYVSDDIFDGSVWDVFESGFVFSPAIVRMRLVGDGEKAFWVTGTICEAKPASDCAKLQQFLRESRPSQPALPAMPTPPDL